ncbi:Acetyltransferase (GNAT) family protein [Halopseudomonas sabulinigri]|uniref:Acetyltransferase (GNAT) family protein n=1 Tax=Halopseudomonas sabulinigri TaxID=472181 RepID=A0A1H1LDW0_9GAMM|nr:GNAT family N-acetyltransferase [Halopseudomonas sabulinigri]SDR72059.1 Acetyltransferase (GNAT) family protein [Halopseudomonas sabulinigri]
MPADIHQLTPLLYPLANRFYRQHQRGTKVGRQHLVWVGKKHDLIVSALCLTPISHGHWLTSLLVAPSHRRLGLAAMLLKHIRHEYAGPIWLFCAPELRPLYEQTGYRVASELPESLQDKLLRYRRHKTLIALINSPPV